MTAQPTPMYTNDVSQAFLRSVDKPLHTPEQLATFPESVAQAVRKDEAYCLAHPPIAIYRLAAEGSQTRDGGVVQKTQSAASFVLPNREEVRAAHTGDQVVYPDGSTARIVTGSGLELGDMALVGSRLSNGDEIINTPQSGVLIVVRKGVLEADDFLPTLQSTPAN